MRTIVVGASSGLGRCIAVGLGQRGDTVALLARRVDRLERAAKEAGPSAVPIACDVTDADSVARAVTEAAHAMGGIDGLVYATGIADFDRIENQDAQAWRRAFDTNVVGAALVTKAAVPFLTDSKGVATYLSSISASITGPYLGLGPYAASKAALEKSVDAWRTEHPLIGFTNLVVGDCGGGEGEGVSGFANDWDADALTELMPVWLERGYIIGSLIDPDDLVHVVHAVLHTGASACIHRLTISPRPPAT
jgi:NADP-dependent 3-hydroxy acid dehydrogenase YdfG